MLCSNARAWIRSWTPSSLRITLNGAAAVNSTGRGNGAVLPGEEVPFSRYCAFFFYSFWGSKGVVFLRFCHFLARGTLFCALPFLLLSCLLVSISFDSDFHVPVLRDGVTPGSAQNHRYVTPVLRLGKPREPVVGNAGSALNPASIAPV